MIVSRALKAGLLTLLGCHIFRATGITVYLLNGGLLEYAQQISAHESVHTTRLYDRRNGQVTVRSVIPDILKRYIHRGSVSGRSMRKC